MFLRYIWWSRAWCLLWCKFLFLWGSWFETVERMFSANVNNFLLTVLIADTWFSLFLMTLSCLHIVAYDSLEWCCYIDAIWLMRKMSLTLISFSLHYFNTVARSMELWFEMFLRYRKLFISLCSSIEGCKSNPNELNWNAAKAAHTITHTPHIFPQLCKEYSALQDWYKHLCFPWNEFPLSAS